VNVSDDRQLRSTLLLGAGFFFVFTAWHSTQNLQSSLVMPAGVSGTTALSIVYSLLPVGFALGHAVVRRFGKKRTILCSMAMYASFIVAQMHPRWWSIYPGAVLVGATPYCACYANDSHAAMIFSITALPLNQHLDLTIPTARAVAV